MIDAPYAEWQSFAKVAENQFELGIFIEQAAAHQTKGMKGIGSVECWRGRIIARFGRNRQ